MTFSIILFIADVSEEKSMTGKTVQRKQHRSFLFFLFLFSPFFLLAQQPYKQVVRGVVVEKNTQEQLQGVTVLVSSEGKEFGTATNEKGEFTISDIPVGRCNISVSMVGFTSYVSTNILIYSGKETVLEIALEEDIRVLQEIVVTPNVNKELPLNQMAVVSTRMLSSEEANRYAGSMSDPARMVANLAGVAAGNDTRNDIVVRGNSPIGIQWRLDGFEIPNPNHFGSMGASGGPVSMLNNNQLANSDFYTGAFPAEFGNVTSGIFDLRLRNGNNKRHEFMTSFGMMSVELGAEGPLSKQTGASYMINGRYSFLGILRAVGVQIGPKDLALPVFQDVCSKVNVPLPKGNLSLIALYGAGQLHQEPDMSDETKWQAGDKGENHLINNRQLFVGLTNTHRFNSVTRWENRLSYQHFGQKIDDKLVAFPDEAVVSTSNGLSGEGKIACQSTLFRRINVHHTIKGGIGIDVYNTNLKTVKRDTVLNDYTGNSALLKAFAQWQYRINDRLSITPGFYTHYYTFNSDGSIEPRLGVRWNVGTRTALSLGGGLYSQLQPRPVYFYEREGVVMNKHVTMNKSWQAVLGCDQKLGEGMRLKTELYYQYLFNIPVIPDIPEESILNLGDEMYNTWAYAFINKGTGRNYGVEVTLEKFFDSHYYFLITGSLYDSKYTAYDGIERNGKFNGNYALNTLFGYEWKIGTKKLLSANTKLAYMGGKRELPMRYNNKGDDIIYDYTHAYTRHAPAYFRLDLNVNMKHNFKRLALEWYLEVNNVTNHKNVWVKYFNVSRNKEEYIYQWGFMPMAGCRVYF
jgi:hypothetical protein